MFKLIFVPNIFIILVFFLFGTFFGLFIRLIIN